MCRAIIPMLVAARSRPPACFNLSRHSCHGIGGALVIYAGLHCILWCRHRQSEGRVYSMRAETQAKIESITATIELLRVHVGYEAAMARLAELELQSAEADFWNDQAVAQEAMREKNRLERQLTMITSLQSEMEDAVGLIELGEIEGDQDVVAEAEEALAQLASSPTSGS